MAKFNFNRVAKMVFRYAKIFVGTYIATKGARDLFYDAGVEDGVYEFDNVLRSAMTKAARNGDTLDVVDPKTNERFTFYSRKENKDEA